MSLDELAVALDEARNLLARPGNEFAWSQWKDRSEALKDIGGAIAKVRAGRAPKSALDLLFAPTGAIQEVSIRNGWGHEFLAVAERYDKAIASVARPWWRFW